MAWLFKDHLQRFGLLIVLISAAVLHHGALRNEIYWDDRVHILGNPMIESWRNLPDMFRHELYYKVQTDDPRSGLKLDTYRPLYNASFLVDRQIWGENYSGFHLTNLLLHLLNVSLAFLLFRRFASPSLALVGAAVFAFHPQTLECIHYVAARADSLTTFFVLLSLTLGWTLRPDSWTAIALASAAFLMAILTKETSITLPLIWGLGAWSLTPSDVRRRLLVRGVAAFGVAAGIYFVLRTQALGETKAVLDAQHIQEMIVNFPFLCFSFLNALLIPIFTMPLQRFEVFRPPFTGAVLLFTGIFYLSLAAALFRFRKQKASPFAVWTLLGLLPSIAAVSLIELMSPRYFYLPLVGAIGVLLILSSQAAASPAMHRWVALGLITVLAASSLYKGANYRTGESFYSAILADNPNEAMAKYNLANTLQRKGDVQASAEIYRSLLRSRPRDSSIYNNYGSALLALGRVNEAIEMYKKALELKPGNPRYESNLRRAEAQK